MGHRGQVDGCECDPITILGVKAIASEQSLDFVIPVGHDVHLG